MLGARYAEALPEEYKASTDIATAVNDIRHVEELRDGVTTRVDIANPIGIRDERFTAIKLYLRGEQLVLSEIMPVLENLGLRVFAEDPVTIPALDDAPIHLHTFFVQDTAGNRLDVRRHGERLAAALLRVRSGRVENDALNRLVLAAGLDWEVVDLLRTYCHYAFQINAAPSRRALIDALVGHPESAALLARHFAARFAPAAGPGASEAGAGEPAPARERAEAARTRQAFLGSLDAVQSIGEDRMLRALLGLVDATVRTNFYRVRARDGDYIALKLACARIEEMPKPRPLYEIFVPARGWRACTCAAARSRAAASAAATATTISAPRSSVS